MSTIIISDQMTHPYSQWLTESLQMIGERNPVSIGIVAILEGGETFTGYYNADATDKAVMAHNINSDVIMDVVRANADKIFYDEEEE